MWLNGIVPHHLAPLTRGFFLFVLRIGSVVVEVTRRWEGLSCPFPIACPNIIL